MKILIAEDDAISRMMLADNLTRHGHTVVAVEDGEQAWEILQSDNPPNLAILDWMMPGIDGIEVCQRALKVPRTVPFYIILLSSRDEKQDVVGGLGGGANDYIVKPFDPSELHARIAVGVRMIHLQQELADRVSELEIALEKVKQLQGMLPICSYCKKIRADQDYWQEVETYIGEHSAAEFSHGICPDCFESMVGKSVKSLR